MPDPIATVGILDDEPEMRKAVRRLLTSRGFQVREFASGTEFLSDAERTSLSCLLLDLHMPEVNGFEVLEALRSSHASMPVIIFTAHDSPGTAERLSALGACAYLKKPVDRDVLMEAIQEAIQQTTISSTCRP